MGWANCGTDDLGRPIGYAHDATCDQEGCEAKIHRGLAYVCGGMHGGDEFGCGKYFCADHLIITEFKDKRVTQICDACYEIAEREGCLAEDK
ncbi:hypothetical protein [Methylocystis sp.]|jgi:hypothetical protein|uniref:hypothetical protein n=1 Tax=Methylocystis sp. TaxID=1911079 RepID=UPI002736D961|nr:hypothetical protein [Methylocystis sp.]MDP3554837.1 hypothetical protein [Methylocystis sp.]